MSFVKFLSYNNAVPIALTLIMVGGASAFAATDPQAIYSRLYPVPVTIESGQGSALYSHVEEAMTVPMPSLDVFDSYVIYVGFDPQGAEVEKKRAVRPAAKPRQR